MKRQAVAAILAIAALGPAGVGGAAAQAATLDPSDPRLMPNPIQSSTEGTAWTCGATGSEIHCTGTYKISWDLQQGPGELCAVPLFSVDGTFSRTQTRFYTYDAASGLYLEYKRLIHLYSNEYFTPVPESTNVVIARLGMTWISTFQTPGDLDSRDRRSSGRVRQGLQRARSVVGPGSALTRGCWRQRRHRFESRDSWVHPSRPGF